MDVQGCNTRNGFVTTRKETDPGSEIDLDVKQGEIGSWLIELPLPLIYDILLRLHAEAILRCRCVCKTFYEVLTDPQFAQDHLTKAPNFDEGLVIQGRLDIRDVLLIYNHKSVHKKIIGDHATLATQTIASPVFVSVSLVGSCNGLICIRYLDDLRNHYYYVCNPILGESLALPYQNQVLDPSRCAFGFCPKTKQYKVIRLFNYSLCKIHTLGTNCWRDISNVPKAYRTRSFDQSFKGFLHWIIKNLTVSKLICSFNLETEQVSLLPTPIHIDQENLHKLFYFQTGTLDGSFCLSYRRGTILEVCVMKNYGVKDSWSKAFSLDHTGRNHEFRDWIYIWHYKVIKGNLFFRNKQSSLVGYNLEKGTFTELLVSKTVLPRIMPFRPSFISLKDVTIASG